MEPEKWEQIYYHLLVYIKLITGGFENLHYSETDQYPSELVDGGYVKWFTIESSEPGRVSTINFENVQWKFISNAFGKISLMQDGRQSNIPFIFDQP